MTTDKFKINIFARIDIIIELLFPIVLVGILFWPSRGSYLFFNSLYNSDKHINLFLLIGALSIWFISSLFNFLRWLTYSVEVSSENIKISNIILKSEERIKWDDITEIYANTKAPDLFIAKIRLKKYIEIKTKDGKIIKIPNFTSRYMDLLVKFREYFPNIKVA
ncbi:MAG TPA: hypothetical protein PLY36_08355 [Spirochaetota bacterium]|nr:hypothetical protein [Spirochaetota bacterium]